MQPKLRHKIIVPILCLVGRLLTLFGGKKSSDSVFYLLGDMDLVSIHLCVFVHVCLHV